MITKLAPPSSGRRCRSRPPMPCTSCRATVSPMPRPPSLALKKGRRSAALQPRRHAGSVVLHAEAQAAAAGQHGVHTQQRSRQPLGCALGISNEVEQGLLQLRSVGPHQQRGRLHGKAGLAATCCQVGATASCRRANRACSSTTSSCGGGASLSWRKSVTKRRSPAARASDGVRARADALAGRPAHRPPGRGWQWG